MKLHLLVAHALNCTIAQSNGKFTKNTVNLRESQNQQSNKSKQGVQMGASVKWQSKQQQTVAWAK